MPLKPYSGEVLPLKNTPAIKPYDGEEFPLGQTPPDLGLLGTLEGGAKSAARAVGSTVQGLVGNNAAIEENAAANLAAEKDTRLEQFNADVADRFKASGEDAGVLSAAADVAGAAWDNPAGAGLALTETLANSAPAMAGGYAGMKAGAAGGAALGSVVPGVGTAVGGAVGGLVGGAAGMWAGNTATEAGYKLMDSAEGGLTDEERDTALKQGAVKGGVITAVDLATLGLGGKLAGAVARAGDRAVNRVLVDAGVDITDAAAVTAAKANPLLAEAISSAQISTTQKAATAAGMMAMETAGEGTGEYLGELAATGEASVQDAVLESVMSLGQSGVETAWNIARAGAKKAVADRLVQPTPTEENPAPAPVDRPDPSNGILSRATNLLPAPAVDDGTLYVDPNGTVSQSGQTGQGAQAGAPAFGGPGFEQQTGTTDPLTGEFIPAVRSPFNEQQRQAGGDVFNNGEQAQNWTAGQNDTSTQRPALTGPTFNGMPAAKKALRETGNPDAYEVVKVGKQSFAVQAKADMPSNQIAGAEIGDGWKTFGDETGSLKVPRADMPQIKAEHRGAMVNFLNARGITHEEQTVPAGELKPTQAEFSTEKVSKAKSFEGGDRSILISSDGHVLDGHHQWLAKLDKGEDVKAIRLNAPMSELLPAVAEFPSSTVDASSNAPVAGNKIATAKEGVATANPAGSLSVRFGNQTFPVESIEDAQTKWRAFRDETKAGNSEIGNGVEVFGADGKQVARISYNGRAWDTNDKEIKPAITADQATVSPETVTAPATAEASIQPKTDHVANLKEAQRRIAAPSKELKAEAESAGVDNVDWYKNTESLEYAIKTAKEGAKSSKTNPIAVTDNPIAVTQAPVSTKPAKRKGARKTVDREKDTVVEAVIRLGGLTNSWKQDTTGDTKGNKGIPGVGYLWSDKNGTGIDDMARHLDDEGYVPHGEMQKDGGVSWLQSVIKDELGGIKKHYAPGSAKYEAEMLQREEDRYAAQADRFDGESDAEYEDQIDALFDRNLTEQEIEAQRKADDDWLAEADELLGDSNENSGSEEVAGAAVGGQGQENQTPAGRPGQEGRAGIGESSGTGAQGAESASPAFTLEAQTEEDLATKEKEQQAAAAAQAAEQQALENKVKADAEVGSFTLTGSNRPSDVGAAAGQNDMFGPKTRGEAKAEAESKPEGDGPEWADHSFTVNAAEEFGPIGASQEAVATAKAGIAGTVTLETGIRPSGKKWHTVYVSQGGGEISHVTLGSQLPESIDGEVKSANKTFAEMQAIKESADQGRLKIAEEDREIAKEQGYAAGRKLGVIIPNTGKQLRAAYIEKDNGDGTFDVRGVSGSKEAVIRGMSASNIKRAVDRFKGAGKKPDVFVEGPDGSIDFGEITPEMANKAGRQAGKIRLQEGVQNEDGTGYGLVHIEAKHGKQIRNSGFESVESFVSEVARRFTQIRKADAGQLLVAVNGDRENVMFVQLQPADDGDYYRINTAFPASRDYLEKREKKGGELLWGGSEPAPAVTGQQPLYAGNSEIDPGQNAPIAQGQSSDRTIAQPETGKSTGKQKAANEDVGEKLPGTGKIEDFGETLLGARKFNTYAEKLKEAEALDVAAVPLSKSWPAPDYQDLIDGGADAWGVAFMRAARDEIPSKPTKGYKLSRWVAQVEQLREFAQQVATDPEFAKSVQALVSTKYASLKGWIGRADLYAQFGHAVSLKGLKFEDHYYQFYKGQNNVSKWVVSGAPSKGGMSNWPREVAVGDTREEALAAFGKVHAKMIAAPETDTGPSVRFDIFTNRSTGEVFIGKKNGKRHAKMKTFSNIYEARDYLKANQKELEAQYEQMKVQPETRGSENAPRVGADYRNGQDVTPELFGETFGFRGVQFGNWVEDKRRQKDLNDAYDGLMDLAGILNIPARALSLNGKLGLAFGARGKGGKDAGAAHYEPDSVVINLTKAFGAGSLAHEWWHSLDNYFSKAQGQTGYLTEDGGARGNGVRPEMVAAFKELMKAVNLTGIKERSGKRDETRSKDYWSTGREMTARSFESYVIAKLADNGIRSDYLANVVSGEAVERDELYPYPTAGEMPKIRAAYDNIFNVIEASPPDESGNVALFSLGVSGASADGKFLDRGAVNQLAIKAVGENAATARFVFTSYASLPIEIREEAASQGVKPGEVKAVHWNGKTYMVDGRFTSAKEAKQAIFHEHYVHFGLRAKYDTALAPKLRSILDGVGGLDGVRELARAQGIDLSKYEKGTLGNKNIPESSQPLIILEELMAHMGHATGTLKRVIQEAVGAIRAWLRKNGYFELSSLGITDLANELKMARKAAQEVDQTGTDGDVRFSFVGKKAATADQMKLTNAQAMLAKGIRAETVRRDTGWFVGVDGKWRFEIADNEARLIDAPIADSWETFFGKMERLQFGKNVSPSTMKVAEFNRYKQYRADREADYKRRNDPRYLQDLLHHPKLFAAYPDMETMQVFFVDAADTNSRGSYYSGIDAINITKTTDLEAMRSTLLHEIQHAIQQREGYATGGNSDASFTNSVKEALKSGTKSANYFLDRWKRENSDKVSAAAKAAEIARYGLMYESATRLVNYAHSDAPSGLFRIIRNEMQWIYAERFRGNEQARDLQYAFHEIPKRHKMRERNAKIAQMALDASQLLMKEIPTDLREQFKNDPRTMKGMLKALERESSKADKQLDPMRKLEDQERALGRVKDKAQYAGAYEIYRALAGEVEARNTQKRLDMDDEQRKNTSIQSTADVDAADVIVMFGGMDVRAPTSMANMDAAAGKAKPKKQTETAAFKEWFGDSKVVDDNGEPLVVYHGTASDIDSFDLSRSGESTKNTGFYGSGAYFTEDVEDANGYAGWAEIAKGEEGGRNIIPAYLALNNPVYIHINPKTEADKVKSRQSLQILLEQMEKKGEFGTYPNPNEAGSLFGKLSKYLVNGEFEKFMGAIYNSQGGGEGATSLARAAGFDGVTVYSFKRGRNMLLEAVAFDPTQVKSAIGNNGSFDKTNPNINYRINSGSASGIPPFSAKLLVKQLNAVIGSDTVAVENEAGLPQHLQDQIKKDGMQGRAAGLHYQGKSYIIASNLRDTKHAIEVLLHEAVGHGGVKSVLGDKLGKVMQGIYRDMPKAMRAELERRYAGQLAGLSEHDAQVVVAEEYVAHMAETDPRNALISRLVALVRKFIRAAFGERQAMKWTRNDIVQLLAEAKSAVAKGNAPKGGGKKSYRESAPQIETPELAEVAEVDEAEFVASLKGPAITSMAKALYKAQGTGSPFFKKWFGKSRMVKDGKPIAFYHRSFDDKQTFDDARLGGNTGTPTAALGHFLSIKDENNVERYGPVSDRFYVKMEKPKVITQAQFEKMGDWSVEQVQAYRADQMKAGHDGLYIQGLGWPVVFEGKNIKGVRNAGTFDETNNTRYSVNDNLDSKGYVSWDVNQEQNEDGPVGPEYVLIEKVHVNEDSRRQGFARKLLREAIAEIKAEHPGMAIKLAADPQHDSIELDDLVAFYESEGFDTVDSNGAPFVVMEYSGAPSNIRYSLNGTSEALRRMGIGKRDTESLLKKFKNLGKAGINAKLADMLKRTQEGIFDGLAGIQRAEAAVGVTDVNQQGYVSARNATGIADVMHGVLHYGAPEWRDGIVSYKQGTRGVLEILADLDGDLQGWLGWLGGKRAELLKRQGKENNLSDADIKELIALGKGKEAHFEAIYQEYNKVNEAVLDLAEKAGLIKPSNRAGWMTDYYVPFYRQDEEGAPSFGAPVGKKGLSHQTAAIKELKGGKMPTKDLLENMLTGWTKRIDASMKNMALLEVVNNLKGSEYLIDEGMKWTRMVVPRNEVVKHIKGDRVALEFWAEQLGLDVTADHLEVAHELNKLDTSGYEELWGQVAPTDPDIIRVQRNGKSEYYRVKDDALLRGLKHMEGSIFNDPITRIGRSFKRILTTGVTASPDFIIRNFIRDAAHAWTINPDGFKFGVDSINGLKNALAEDQDYRDLMFAGASFQGGYVHGTDPEASAQIIRRALEKKGLSKGQQDAFMGTLVNTPARSAEMLKSAWQMYREFGDKIENSNRLSTYKAALASGKSRRQAAYEAKDLMDYSMRGNFAAAVWFTDMVPFLNARLQGLYKLGRATKGDKTLIAKHVATKAGYIMLFSLLLAGANDDDERYKELQDWDKDMSWHIWLGDEHFRIPKPFELGLIFGTIPERMLHTGFGSQDSGDLSRSIAHGVFDTLAFNPVPQFYQPIREVQANRNFFRDMPIEGMGDEGKLPAARYDERTSAAGKMLGQLTGPTIGLSPKQIDHLVQGYTGTMGAYVLSMSNVIAGALTDGERPDLTAGDVPVVKALYQGDAVRGTKYQTEFYDALSEADQIHRTVTAYRKEGRKEEAEELRTENAGKLLHRKALGFARQQLGAVRDKMNAVSRSTTLTGAQKREQLDDLQRRSNAIAERIAKRVEADF